MEEVIGRLERAKNDSVKKRQKIKEDFDKSHRNLSTLEEKGKLMLSVSQLQDAGFVTLIQEGAVIDPIGLRFIISRGTAQNALNTMLDSGVTKIEVNADHDSNGILTGAIGYVDMLKATIVSAENNTSKLIAPVVFDEASVAVKEIKRQQSLGARFGVSIEMADEGLDYTSDDSLPGILITNFQIKNLAVVREGANVSSNNILFNLNIMTDTNINNKLNADEVVNISGVDTPVVDTPVVDTEEEAVDVVQAVADATAQAEASQVEAETAKAEAEKARAEAEAVKAELSAIKTQVKGMIKIKKLEVNTKLAPTTVTPYTGTTYQPEVVDLSYIEAENDAIVDYLLANDNDREYPLQPTDHVAGNYKPIVRSNEFFGWELGAFNPLTECCWNIDATGKAGSSFFTAGTACVSVDTDMWGSLYTVNDQGLRFGNVGLSPFEQKNRLAVSTLRRRAYYGMVQGIATAPASAIPNWDGLLGVFSVAPTTLSGAGSILASLDTVITRFSTWFSGEVTANGNGLVAFMHTTTVQAIMAEMRQLALSGVCCLTLQEKESLNSQTTITSYRGIRIIASPKFIIDVSNTPTAGLTEIYVTTEGNVAGKLRYLTMDNGVIDYSNGDTVSPIQIGANALSAVPDCELSSKLAYFVLGIAYAKSRFKLARITNVQSQPYGVSALNGTRDLYGVHFSVNFTGN
jgi:hypothetical protein